MITPTKKRLAHAEVAMLLAEKGLDNIPDTATLLNHRMSYINNIQTFKNIFSNYGSMILALDNSHPDLMEIARQKNAPAPKAKPAVKSAVKKEK